MQPTVSADIKTYKIDEAHSNVRFWVRHLMISKVHGELSDLTGTVEYNAADHSQTQIDVVIDASAITTKNDQRDGHLKSGDFLDVEKYPTITYKSTSVTKTAGNEFDVVGDFTLHGVTKPVTLKVEVSDEVPSPFGGFKVGVSAKGEINREDFGVLWNQALETGGIAVGKEIHFEIDLELDRA
jgi:polyisoprenoid-binding protein YceI